MKFLKFLFVGIFFGIILVKSEAVSWYRIFEMFKFQSFHMYGIIGSAVFTGATALWVIKKFKIKNSEGSLAILSPKETGFIRYIMGGIIFGLGIRRRLPWTHVYFIRYRCVRYANRYCSCNCGNFCLWSFKKQTTTLNNFRT